MIYQFGDFRLDIARQELWHGGETIDGEPMVLDLLRLLVENPDRLVIPAVLQEAVDNRNDDDRRPISGPSTIDWARKLASLEGLLTGISGGTSFAAAIEAAEDMTCEEVVISRSTPNYQMS